MYTPSIHHFKAFPVSKINFKTSFLYLLFKEKSNFIVLKMQGYFLSIFYYFYYLLCVYTPSNQHFKPFPVSKINSETSFLYQHFEENQISQFQSSFFNLSIYYYFYYDLCTYTPSNQHLKVFLVSKSIPRQVFCINS